MVVLKFNDNERLKLRVLCSYSQNYRRKHT
jgi:hypothetical protein